MFALLRGEQISVRGTQVVYQRSHGRLRLIFMVDASSRLLLD